MVMPKPKSVVSAARVAAGLTKRRKKTIKTTPPEPTYAPPRPRAG